MLEKYIVQENGIIPAWLNDELARGRAKINYYDEKIVSITVYSVNGSNVANIGDVIIKTESGLAAIPKEKAIQYKIIMEPVAEYSIPAKRRKR